MSTLKIDTREVDRIAGQLKVKTEAVIRRIAFEVEGLAKQNAPYDTGALRSSIYTVTDKYDGYEKAASAVQSSNPDAEISPLPTPEPGTAFVGSCVEYAVWVERPGRVLRGGQRPFLQPAAETIGKKYNSGAAWQELVK